MSPVLAVAVDAARVPAEPVGILVMAAVLLPLAGAAIAVLAHGHLRVQRAVSLTTTAAAAVSGIALLRTVAVHGTVVVQAGGWPAPVI